MSGFTSLAEALRLEATGPGRLDCLLLPAWRHGSGIYGGLQATLLLEAMRTVVEDPARRPRALTAQFIAPATPGPATCTVRMVRRGRSFTQMAGTLHRGGTVFARAAATFAVARASQPYNRVPAAPRVPSWSELPDSQHGDRPPVFLTQLQFRDCIGEAPYSGAEVAHLGGWGRFVQATALTPATVTSLFDAWPPAILACYGHMERAASVELSITLHPAVSYEAPQLDVPVLYEARSDAISEGFSEERARMWAPDGGLLATGVQRIVVFD